MSERIKNIPQTAKEKLSVSRKLISEKLGRLASNITFDQSGIEVSSYDEDNPEKYTQDLNFATYELNLREAHYQDQKEVREYYKDKAVYRAKIIGSTVMLMPGMNTARELIKDSRSSRKRLKMQRKKYIERNGTVKSNLSKRYHTNIEKFSKEKNILENRKKDILSRSSSDT